MEAEIQPDPGKFGEGGGCSSNSASTLQANEVWQFTNMYNYVLTLAVTNPKKLRFCCFRNCSSQLTGQQ